MKTFNDDIRTLMLIKNLTGFKSIRSALPYLADNSLPQKIEKVIGLENIAKCLGFNWSKQADIKRAQRTLRKYDMPYSKEGNKIWVYKSDINKLKDEILVGKKAIADFLGVSSKTLSRWLKLPQYTKMPISRDKTPYANKNKLRKWNIMRIARKAGIP